MASSLKPCHDQAIVIPRPDIHAKILGAWDDGIQDGVISTALWGNVRVDCPLSYKIPAKRNSFAIVQVDSWGEGTLRGAGMDKPEVEVGDLVGIDLCQVGHRLSHGGKEKYFIPWKEFLCKFDKDLNPRPLMNFVMTESDESLMNHLIFKGNSTLIATASTHASGIRTNSKEDTNVRVSCERVIDVGQGRFVKSALGGAEQPGFAWQEPLCKIGDGVIFMTFNGTVDMQFKGPRKRFTPWSEIEAILSVEEDH